MTTETIDFRKFEGLTSGPWETDCAGRIIAADEIKIGKMYASTDAQAVAQLPSLLSSLQLAVKALEEIDGRAGTLQLAALRHISQIARSTLKQIGGT